MIAIVYIVLGLLASCFFVRLAIVIHNNEDLIACYISKKNSFLTESNDVIKDFETNVRWFLFTILIISMVSIFFD